MLQNYKCYACTTVFTNVFTILFTILDNNDDVFFVCFM